jgi:DNA invertase Pin-like site-specific DNA recombinase
MSDAHKNAENGDLKETVASPVPAALYVRAACFTQAILDEQCEALECYAERNNLLVVRRYVEGGQPGKMCDALMDAVLNGSADFTVIIMRDVSRWGRFRDADVSPYYEYTCLCAGIKVRYVIEETGNAFPETLSPSPTAYSGGVESVLKR